MHLYPGVDPPDSYQSFSEKKNLTDWLLRLLQKLEHLVGESPSTDSILIQSGTVLIPNPALLKPGKGISILIYSPRSIQSAVCKWRSGSDIGRLKRTGVSRSLKVLSKERWIKSTRTTVLSLDPHGKIFASGTE